MNRVKHRSIGHGRHSAGFTLAEVLLAVAIITILGAFSFASAVSMKTSLKQRTLDEAAKTIYLAAQRNLAGVMAFGNTGKLKTEGEGRVLNASPSRSQIVFLSAEKYDSESSSGKLYYLCSDDKDNGSYTDAFHTLLPDGAADDELSGGNWLITYYADDTEAQVLDVFYAQADGAAALVAVKSAPGDYCGEEKASARNALKGHIGYYGGELGSGVKEDTDQLKNLVCSLSAPDNTEELSVTAYCRVPEDPHFMTSDVAYCPVTFRLAVTGMTSGKTGYKEVALNEDETLDTTKHGDSKGKVTSGVDHKDFEYRFVLDSLNEMEIGSETLNLNFKNQIFKNEGGSEKTAIEIGLIPGEDLRISLSAVCNGFFAGKGTGTDERSAFVNSLYAGRGPVSGSPDKDVIHVAYGRHLQNLDVGTSGVDATNSSGSAVAVANRKSLHVILD